MLDLWAYLRGGKNRIFGFKYLIEVFLVNFDEPLPTTLFQFYLYNSFITPNYSSHGSSHEIVIA